MPNSLLWLRWLQSKLLSKKVKQFIPYNDKPKRLLVYEEETVLYEEEFIIFIKSIWDGCTDREMKAGVILTRNVNTENK